MSLNIPVVISHSGDDDYFKAVTIIAAQKNFVYVIGDAANSKTFEGIAKIEHVHKEDLYTEELRSFESAFVNYSSNSHEEELRCFRRVFLAHHLMKVKDLTHIFHLDSDCLLLESVSKFISLDPASAVTAYALMPNYYPFFMAACIHNALLSRDFCNQFSKLCNDIYVTKSKFDLIAPKIKWHSDNKVGGGICDMTMYYLLHSENLVSVLDLNQAFMINDELCIFDHNINIEFGPAGDNTFKLKNGMKKVLRLNEKYYCETKEGVLVRAITLHFQGSAKKFIPEFYAVGNF